MMNNDSAAFGTRVQEEFDHRVERRLETVTVSDGTRLSIKLWLPEGSAQCPTGVVLEAIPYRKDDVSVIDDETRFGFFAGNGIACARLDLRGSGASTGVLVDEYTTIEQRDIEEIVYWLADQPWCNGSVGMIGISWSGFNALQVAAKRPAPLKAIVTACSTDDRYDNDVHYLGGVPLAFYMNLWGSALTMMNMRPPMPETAGPQWLEEWTTRLRINPDVTSLWLSHPYRDSYWRQGSVCEHYASIDCGVMLVGGWADNYTDTVFRVLRALPNAQAIVGPWGHTWPERPEPGPGIDFLGRCVRFWRHWLLGEDNGVDRDPRLCFYVQDYVYTREDLPFRPGRWWGVNDLDQVVASATYPLGTGGQLGVADTTGSTVRHQSALSVGTQGRHMLPMGVSTDLPGVQDADDAGSLLFETPVLTEELVILGRAELRLTLSSSTSAGHVFARITDVDADGHSHLVTRGALNLAHRHGHAPEDIAPMTPGEVVTVTVPIKASSYRFAPGHRLRLAVSTNYWPWLWPATEQGEIEIALADSAVVLPILDEESGLLVPVDLGEPVIAPVPGVVMDGDAVPTWTVETSADGWTRVCRGAGGSTSTTLDSGWSITYEQDDSVYGIHHGDPLSAWMERSVLQRYSWPGHEVVLTLTTRMSGDADNFTVHRDCAAVLDRKLHFREESTGIVPRGL